jgi:hypothetical protein
MMVRLADANRAFGIPHGEVEAVTQLIRNRAEEFHANETPATPTSWDSLTPSLAQEYSKAVLLPRLLAHVEALCERTPEAETETAATKLQSAVR